MSLKNVIVVTCGQHPLLAELTQHLLSEAMVMMPGPTFATWDLVIPGGGANPNAIPHVKPHLSDDPIIILIAHSNCNASTKNQSEILSDNTLALVNLGYSVICLYLDDRTGQMVITRSIAQSTFTQSPKFPYPRFVHN